MLRSRTGPASCRFDQRPLANLLRAARDDFHGRFPQFSRKNFLHLIRWISSVNFTLNFLPLIAIRTDFLHRASGGWNRLTFVVLGTLAVHPPGHWSPTLLAARPPDLTQICPASEPRALSTLSFRSEGRPVRLADVKLDRLASPPGCCVLAGCPSVRPSTSPTGD